jgi:hypothetical protein
VQAAKWWRIVISLDDAPTFLGMKRLLRAFATEWRTQEVRFGREDDASVESAPLYVTQRQLGADGVEGSERLA